MARRFVAKMFLLKYVLSYNCIKQSFIQEEKIAHVKHTGSWVGIFTLTVVYIRGILYDCILW